MFEKSKYHAHPDSVFIQHKGLFAETPEKEGGSVEITEEHAWPSRSPGAHSKKSDAISSTEEGKEQLPEKRSLHAQQLDIWGTSNFKLEFLPPFQSSAGSESGRKSFSAVRWAAWAGAGTCLLWALGLKPRDGA